MIRYTILRLGWPCLFGRGPSVGVAAPAGLPVGPGALGAPGLAQDGGLAAVPAYAEFLGLLPLFLGVVPVILLALWSLGPALVVRPPFLLAGFHMFWGRLDPRPRLPGLRCGFGSGLLPAGRLLFGLGFSGSWLAWRGGFLGLCPALGLLEWEAIDEYLSFRRTHPRACGGTAEDPETAEEQRGLSPRLRGNHQPDGVGVHGDGSIPAPAGEPSLRPPDPSPPGVYPRACGGTLFANASGISRWGLSPRLRGNHSRTAGLPGRLGSIPAPAGEPLLRSSTSGDRQPPAITRSIPAPAGEPFGESLNLDLEGVYPRACGGSHLAPVLGTTVRKGQPEHVAGRHGFVVTRILGLVPEFL